MEELEHELREGSGGPRVAIAREDVLVMYTVSAAVLEAVGTLDADACVEWYEDLVETLKQLRGVERYSPMYPNFPRQVMEARTAELYVNAMLHYLTAWISDIAGDERGDFIWRPKYDVRKREPLAEQIKPAIAAPVPPETVSQTA